MTLILKLFFFIILLQHSSDIENKRRGKVSLNGYLHIGIGSRALHGLGYPWGSMDPRGFGWIWVKKNQKTAVWFGARVKK